MINQDPNRSSWTSPDRREVMSRADSSAPALFCHGVEVRELVGASRGARGVFTGLLTLEPGRLTSSYTRPDNEVLILLDGEAAVDVEARRHRLATLDHAAIPASLPRRIVNLSAKRPATFHVSVASSSPTHTTADEPSSVVDQPVDWTGPAGAERIGRNAPEARHELAPGAMFQDFFNASMGMTGICGGYGLFEPGSRLPCHRHEFDESITIVQGMATCVVEGNRYELSDNATALVPQGRCHYFINLTDAPMAMIWVYAGDMPDRIVLEESYCHPEMGQVS
jgi:quercetin dioxygenase-like cupin family protein